MGEKASPPCLVSTTLVTDLTLIFFLLTRTLSFGLMNHCCRSMGARRSAWPSTWAGLLLAHLLDANAVWNTTLWVACFCGLLCYLNRFSCPIIRPDATFFFRREVKASTGNDARRHLHQYARLHNLPYFDVWAEKIRVLLAWSWSVPLR